MDLQTIRLDIPAAILLPEVVMKLFVLSDPRENAAVGGIFLPGGQFEIDVVLCYFSPLERLDCRSRFFIEDGAIHTSAPSIHPDFINRMRLKSLTPR
ncbi:MAG: hypothetical protein H6Q52_1846 [Deltaproteobacteria bacterium]|nr:hypothetical protein [Deltaproteobacteria bacterium]